MIRFPLTLLLIAAVFIAGLAFGEQRPPNVVILFADDLGYGDLGSYGHPSIRTPNLDRLAADGQRWTDFYVAAPVCSPSRGALLTGKYPVRTGLYGERINVMFPGDPYGIPTEETTLAEALKSAGYATAVAGKWHLGDAPDALPTRHGFDYWLGLPYSNDMDWADGTSFTDVLAMRAAGRAEEIGALYTARGQRYFAPQIDHWNVPLMESSVGAGGYSDAILERPADQRLLTRKSTDAALAFIEAHRDEPFFLYVPYSMPHTPIFRSEAFTGRSRGGRYGDVIEELDASVGEIVAGLRSAGVSQNTLVIFTSDNGPWLTMRQHGGSAGSLRQGKGTTFEGGFRVPMVASWPGRLQPGVVHDMGSTLDLFATVTTLAGIEGTGRTDGHDLSDTLLLGAPGPRESLAFYRGGELRAFRHGAYKLHLITEGAYGQPPVRTVHEAPLLYHLGEDPAEQFDIAAREPEMVERILAEIDRHRDEVPVAEPLFDRRLE
jgi:uncharacterized sulfatase